MKTTTFNPNPNTLFNWNYNLSKHSQRRIRQRGISYDLVNLALDYSTTIFKQGLVFFMVVDRKIPDNMAPHLKERLRNIVVVVSTVSNEIVTCYKSRESIKHIRKKSKKLSV